MKINTKESLINLLNGYCSGELLFNGNMNINKIKQCYKELHYLTNADFD